MRPGERPPTPEEAARRYHPGDLKALDKTPPLTGVRLHPMTDRQRVNLESLKRPPKARLRITTLPLNDFPSPLITEGA